VKYYYILNKVAIKAGLSFLGERGGGSKEESNPARGGGRVRDSREFGSRCCNETRAHKTGEAIPFK